MANEVSICANALVKLGDDPIASLSDNTNRARHANRLWPIVRDAVLRDHPWNCARKRVTLAQLATTPDWGYAYQYQLPTDFIRMVETSPDPFTFTIEEDRLLTDEATVKIVYIYRKTDAQGYDAALVDALTARMAFELANAISGRRALASDMWAEYQTKLPAAKAVNGQDAAARILADYTLINVR